MDTIIKAPDIQWVPIGKAGERVTVGGLMSDLKEMEKELNHRAELIVTAIEQMHAARADRDRYRDALRGVMAASLNHARNVLAITKDVT